MSAEKGSRLYVRRHGRENIMELKELSKEQLSAVYNNYMTKDFPADELKPLARILHTMDTGLCCAYGIFEQGGFRGYAVFIVPGGLRYGLIDYFAVLPEYRGTGVGHRFLERIGDTLVTKYPELRGFFIESEDAAFAADEKERGIRMKRISFYERNGCRMTTLGSELFGVTYRIMLCDFYAGTGNEEKMPGIDDLDAVYRAMFEKHHYENSVRLWQQ